MRQEVNLYKDEFLPKYLWLSFFHLVTVSLIFAIFLGFYSYQRFTHFDFLKKENLSLTKKSKQLGDDESMSLMERIIEKRKVLEQQVNLMSMEVEGKRRIKGAYDSSKSLNVSSFYNIFLSVGKESNTKLSVSEIGVYDGGKEVIIFGLSETRDDVPNYLKRLKDGPSFSDSNFGLLKINQLDSVGLYEFFMVRKNGDSRFIDGFLEKDKGGSSLSHNDG